MTKLNAEKATQLLREGKNDAERLRGVRWLLEHGGPEGIRLLLGFRKSEGAGELARTVDKFLVEKGVIIDLKPFIVNDWFDSMIRNIEGFEEVCDLVGYKFVAFSMVSGITLRAVNHNPENPQESTIEFSIGGEDRVNEMALEEFRKTLIVSLLSPDPEDPEGLTGSPTKEEISKLIGVRYVLLSPLYGIHLKRLAVVGPETGPAGYLLELLKDGREADWTIAELRQNLRKLVSGERTREREPVGRFSPESIGSAEKALEAGNPSSALEHLRDWILFVRNYKITGGIAQFIQEPDAHFARGLLLTGRAYRLLKRNRIAEDIIRFSIQLLPMTKLKPNFLYELAMIMMGEGRYGEAIGPLRKALQLGIPKARIYPHLGRAFLECDRVVGAFLLFGELNKDGMLDDDSLRWYDESRRRLGDAVEIVEELPPPDENATQ